jgi:hypothetical protein
LSLNLAKIILNAMGYCQKGIISALSDAYKVFGTPQDHTAHHEGVHVFRISSINDPMWSRAYALLSRCFRQDELDSLKEFKFFLLSNALPASPYREFFYVGLNAEKIEGFLHITYHKKTRWAYGNFLAVDKNSDSAQQLLNEMKARINQELFGVLQCKGVWFEVAVPESYKGELCLPTLDQTTLPAFGSLSRHDREGLYRLILYNSKMRREFLFLEGVPYVQSSTGSPYWLCCYKRIHDKQLLTRADVSSVLSFLYLSMYGVPFSIREVPAILSKRSRLRSLMGSVLDKVAEPCRLEKIEIDPELRKKGRERP